MFGSKPVFLIVLEYKSPKKGMKKIGQSEKEKMLQGEWYQADDPELHSERLHARKLTRLFNETIETEESRRTETVWGFRGQCLYRTALSL